MTPWTPTARRELESILDGLRPTLTQSGADPDEVLDDLRRHVSEEASVARLTIVTEADVRRLVERVAPVPRLEDFDRLARRGNGSTPPSPPTSVGPHHQSSTEAKPPVPPAKRPGGRGEIATALLWVFGVVLPVITVIYELATGHCRAEFFDPMPSLWHVLMVAAVPIANSLVLREARIRGGPIGDAGSGTVDSPGEGTEAERRRIRWVWAANGIAVAVSSSYALLFLPMMPAAIIAVILLLGIFALAPLRGLDRFAGAPLSIVEGNRARIRTKTGESSLEDGIRCGGVGPAWPDAAPGIDPALRTSSRRHRGYDTIHRCPSLAAPPWQPRPAPG
jgi:hypothetical protein